VDYFLQHYNRSAYLRGMFQAAYNNLPAAAATATINAVQEARKSVLGVSTDRFVSIYGAAIIAAYAARKDTGIRVVTETKSGLTP
jgi:ribosomal protein L18